MSVVDRAVYAGGRRVNSPATIPLAAAEIREYEGGSAFGWIGMLRPSQSELEAVQEAFGVHALALEDAQKGHQRSKLEWFGDDLAVVVRAAHYVDSTETVRFGEIHIFVCATGVVTIRQAAFPDLAPVRRRLEKTPAILEKGRYGVLYAVLDEVVDSYGPVVMGLENDIYEIEDEIFRGTSSADVSRRIYELHREVIEFQRAIHPLDEVLADIRSRSKGNSLDVELRRLFRDVHDHVIRTIERVDNFRSLLDNALTVQSAITAQRLTEAGFLQNEQTKRISAWAAILFAPTLVGTIYGMNFEHMPELSWVFGYPLALVLMGGVSTTLYLVFRRLKWL